MIKKISKIKGLGVFSDYKPEPGLPDFKRFNLIYGWNGSGKTTLSRLFSALESGLLEDFRDLEYSVATDAGSVRSGEKYSNKVRVFNSEYVEKNVQVLDSRANPIYVLGEENKLLLDEINQEEKVLAESKEKLINHKKRKEELEKNKGKIFTDIARIISANASGEATRKYDKREAESHFYQLNESKLLPEDAMNLNLLTMRQTEKPSIQPVDVPEIIHEDNLMPVGMLIDALKSRVNKLFGQTVDSEVIDRLKSHDDIAQWAEDGIKLHAKHSSKNCEFCAQKIPEERLASLREHFSEADEALKNEADSCITTIDEIERKLSELIVPDKANFYEEQQELFQIVVLNFASIKKDFINQCIKIRLEIQAKKFKTTEIIRSEFPLDGSALLGAIEDLNVIISSHNGKTNNFIKAKAASRLSLENHYLSTIKESVANIDFELSQISNNIEKLTKNNYFDVLESSILGKKNEIMSSGAGCEEINRKLEMFLGMSEIKLIVCEDGGYEITRNGIVAKHLSEGEKTAIAFVYFTVHLSDQDFTLTEGIVVVDDPVSSLDANAMFQAFAFLKNSVKDAKQIFIFTHNFDFLKLTLNWLKSHNSIKKQSKFFMIKNRINDDARRAYLDLLDSALEKYESEYHYLFQILYEFRSDSSIERSYNIPNIARKVLESFLMFRVPKQETMFNRLQVLNDVFDPIKITAIYKFVNDQSHMTGSGFSPSLIPETQKTVVYILDLIKTTFPEHFKILEESMGGVCMNEEGYLAPVLQKEQDTVTST